MDNDERDALVARARAIKAGLGELWDPKEPGGCSRRVEWPYPVGPVMDRGSCNAILAQVCLAGVDLATV